MSKGPKCTEMKAGLGRCLKPAVQRVMKATGGPGKCDMTVGFRCEADVENDRPGVTVFDLTKEVG